MSGSIEKTIDIEKILKNKMGSKAKFVPGFLVSWLKKIIHEDEVNKFLWGKPQPLRYGLAYRMRALSEDGCRNRRLGEFAG